MYAHLFRDVWPFLPGGVLLVTFGSIVKYDTPASDHHIKASYHIGNFPFGSALKRGLKFRNLFYTQRGSKNRKKRSPLKIPNQTENCKMNLIIISYDIYIS